MRTRRLLAGAAIIVGTIVAGPLSCQETNRRVGLKTGAITTGVDSDVAAFLNTDWRTGFTAGGFISFDPTSSLSVQANLFFSQRGFGFRMYQEVAGLIPGEANVKSIEFHLDLGLRLPWRSERVSPRLFAGPALGFELSCKVNGSMLGVEFKEECDQPEVGLQTQTVDLGVSFGGGVDFFLRPATVVLEGRYTNGLRNLNEHPDGRDGLKSRAWSITVGLGWPF